MWFDFLFVFAKHGIKQGIMSWPLTYHDPCHTDKPLDITSKCMWIFLDDLWLTALRMNLKEIKEFGNERMSVYERGCAKTGRLLALTHEWAIKMPDASVSGADKKIKKHIAWHCLYPFKKQISAWKKPLDAHTIPLVKSIVIWPLPLLNKLCSEPWPHGSR